MTEARRFWFRVAIREAHAEMGSVWLALWATALTAIIPIAAFTGFGWNAETKIALVTAAISYPITFAFVVGRKAIERYRDGHPHFRTQIDPIGTGFIVWLMLKDGSPPQGVHELGLFVRRLGKQDHGVILPGTLGTRTVGGPGPMPPHCTYPDDFPGAPPVEEGVYQVVWSDVRRGKRRDFLFDEQYVRPATPRGESSEPGQAPEKDGRAS